MEHRKQIQNETLGPGIGNNSMEEARPGHFRLALPGSHRKKKKEPKHSTAVDWAADGQDTKKINVEPLGRRRVVFLKHPMSAGRVKRRRRRSA